MRELHAGVHAPMAEDHPATKALNKAPKAMAPGQRLEPGVGGNLWSIVQRRLRVGVIVGALSSLSVLGSAQSAVPSLNMMTMALN